MTDPTNPTQPNPPPQETDARETAESTATVETDALQRELEEMRDRHLRLAAEFDNFRRRTARERQEAGWRAQGELVRGLLDALDDIKRFADIDPTTIDCATVVEGVQLVEKKILKSLGGHGFEIIDPTDHPFDPALHEAVSTTAASRPEEDDTVATTFQVGYVINGLVLRPARVVVRQWRDDSDATPVS